ncbi:hypothetical protein V6N11_063835 [Hibiscus sabdariffa]|uniref:EF-hand domain-containing protein n=1 Tax=Hibiscus sabdariffa TaxID=183260 RepID=A0ABR2PLV3_9ROSI
MCPSERNLNRPDNGFLASDFRSAFEILDVNRDGKINKEDLRRFYAGFSNGFNDDDEMIGTMISLADLDRDGFMEYEEFVCVLRGHKKKVPSGYGVMEDVFRVMDKDGDERLSHQDLKSYMNWVKQTDWVGFSVSDEDIKAMIRLGSGDGGNCVTFDRLLKILAVDFSG